MTKNELLTIKEFVHALDNGTFTTDEFLSWLLRQSEGIKNEESKLDHSPVINLGLMPTHVCRVGYSDFDVSVPDHSPSDAITNTKTDTITQPSR